TRVHSSCFCNRIEASGSPRLHKDCVVPQNRIMRLIGLLSCIVWAASAQLTSYDRTLAQLSEPAATRWQHFGPPYFSTNEKLLNRFYSRFDSVGGVTVGVSFQQNFSLL